MRRAPLLMALGALAIAAFALFGLGNDTQVMPTGTSEAQTATQEDETMDQTRSPMLEQSLAAFEAAGASPQMMALLQDIADSDGADATLIEAVAPDELSRAFAPVPTRHAGEASSALVFALDAGNEAAMVDLVAAGADPTAANGLYPEVAVLHHTGSVLDRDWELSVRALDLYVDAGGDPTFSSPTANRPLFALALGTGNLPGALRLFERGADVLARTRKSGQKPGILMVRTFGPENMVFLATVAEAGALNDASADVIDDLIGFYADGFLDVDGTAPDPSFPHSGSADRAGVNKAVLVQRLFRALQPMAPENAQLDLVLSFDVEGGSQ